MSKAVSKAISKDGYSPLSPDRIRLLHLLPNEDERAGIQCELFEYPLQELGKGTRLYEALSYVWGSLDNPRSISIGGYDLPVTANLHAALSRLRDRYIVRTIWVDAVCINQANEEEKGHQIQSMARIYGQANRVIVWLGEAADNSDRAVEEIRTAAGKQSTNSSNEKPIQQAILALLQRPWFRRIWVLQEVAAARHILIVCGSMEIDGFAFCLGVDLLKVFYKDLPDLQGLIRSVTYLIRGAIFRPKYATSRSGTASLDICPLGELIDMYHTHEATLRHDKVYALLGMSSDNLGKASMSPEYGVPWEELLERLIKFLLCEKASVETQGDRREMAVIKSKGCILGQVSSVKGDSTRYDSQDVDVVFTDTHRSLEYKKKCGTRWTLQVSAKPIWKGDLVCLLDGASKPTIIRPCKDHFAIIMIVVTPQQYVRTESGCNEHQEPLASTKIFLHNFLLVWNWEKSLGNLQDQARYKTSAEINTLVPEHLTIASNKAVRLCDMALVLGNMKEYEEAEKKLQEAVEGFEEEFGKENPHTLIYKSQQQLKEAGDLFLQAIRIIKHVLGIDHQNTLDRIANIVSICLDHGHSSTRDQEMVTILTDRIRNNIRITEEEMVWVTRSFGKEIISLLLELKSKNVPVTEEVAKAAARREDNGQVIALLLNTEVKITEDIIKAAAENGRSSLEVMVLLLDQYSTEVWITEELVKVAFRNWQSGKKVMKLLLNRCNDRIIITPKLVQIFAKWLDVQAMKVLLDQYGNKVQITEEVVKAAAENDFNGEEVMKLLLNRYGTKVKMTEEIVKAAARNKHDGEKVMILLLNRYGTKVKITEEVVKTAASNEHNGEKVMIFLLDRYSTKVKITEEVVKAAAGNGYNGEEVMILLLDRYSNKVKITEEIVKAAARNEYSGKNIMMLFLNHYGTNINITEEVLKEAASNKSIGHEIIELLHEIVDIEITVGVIEAAATSGQEQVLGLLDQWGSINSDKQQWLNISCLYNAAKYGHTDIVRQLIADGIPPDKQNIYGETPLLWAAASGYSEIVQLLLNHGAIPNYTYRDGGSLSLQLAHHGTNLHIIGLPRD